MRLLPFAAVLLLVDAAQGQSSRATYRVTFSSTWSASTHPIDFPSNPHFSGLVGATHTAAANFWNPGTTASIGIESMAEMGRKTELLAEVAAKGADVSTVLSGGGIALSPGAVSLTFETDSAHPFVSLVSMVAPSPDWFVGVHGLDLRDGPSWSSRLEIPLDVYDAGSDSGESYTSPDLETAPRGVVTLLATGPFVSGGRVGSFVFELQQVTSVDRADDLPGSDPVLGVPYPNPALDRIAIPIAQDGAGRSITLEVFDVLGRRVRSETVDPGRAAVELSLADFEPGIYFIRSGTAGTRKFVVRR